MLCDIQSLVMIIEIMMMMMMMTGWVIEEGVEEGEAEAVSIHLNTLIVNVITLIIN